MIDKDLLIRKPKGVSHSSIIVYGLASLFDGVVMIITLGSYISSARMKTALWFARKGMK